MCPPAMHHVDRLLFVVSSPCVMQPDVRDVSQCIPLTGQAADADQTDPELITLHHPVNRTGTGC
jgi:hypothetical protein